MNRDLIMFFLSLKQPRRIKVIENILIKRRTVSTLFWGMRYGIIDFWGIIHRLDARKTERSLQQLIKDKLIYRVDANHYLLTDVGSTWLHNRLVHLLTPLTPNLNTRFDLLRFKDRFLLATQIVSEFSYQNAKYYPMLSNDTDNYFIKRWFHRFKNQSIIKQFVDGLNAFLTTLSQTQAWQFTSLLNGHSVIGMTILQQSVVLKNQPTLLGLNELSLFNRLIRFIIDNCNQYPQLFELLDGLNRSLVSTSALRTYQMFEQQFDIQSIAYQRRIKLSTVKEHLLETAILLPVNQINYERFFKPSVLKQLANLYQGNIDDWQFNTIKLRDSHFDYFHFRMYQILRSKLNEKN